MKTTATIAILISLILTGCMSPSVFQMPEMPEMSNVYTNRVGSSPELGQENSTDVGSTIYMEYEYQEIQAVKLTQDVASSVANIPANTTMAGMRIDGVLAYQPYAKSNLIGILLNDQDDDGRFDRIQNMTDLNNNWVGLQPAVPYEDTENISVGEDGLKLELVYQGKTGNAIGVLYREYVDDMARPAFSQNVEYDLNEDGTGTIAFKGARIQVLEATSTEITYEVIRGFEN